MDIVKPVISAKHQEALAYARDGIPVFPCKVNGKEPACPHGFLDATTDTEQINAWWNEADYNIAIEPERAGWGVVDLDKGGRKTWDALCSVHGPCGETTWVRTPSGGEHLYFRGSLPGRTRKLGAGIDTRGCGSYVLVPPSYVIVRPGEKPDYPEGYAGAYEWASEAPIAELPGWVSELLRPIDAAPSVAKGEPVTFEHLRNLLRYIGGAETSRNEWRDIVAAIRNCNIEGDEDEMGRLGLSCEWSRGDLTVDTPGNYTGDEAVEEVFWSMPPSESGVGYGTIYHAAKANGYTGSSAAAPNETVEETYGAALDKLKADELPRSSHPRFYAYTEDEQDAFTEPDWIVPELVPDQSIIMWYGPTGSYKSFLALDLALGLSYCRPTFGFEPERASQIVYVAGEGPRSIARHRRTAWKIARQAEGNGAFYLVRSMPLLANPREFPELAEQIKAQKISPKLIILDTAATAMAGTDENSAKDATNFLSMCNLLRDMFRASVLFVHHTGKNTDNGARGSSALGAGVDAAASFQAWSASRAVSVSVHPDKGGKMKDSDPRREPWTFQGQPIGRSLVFTPTTPQEHGQLTRVELEFTGPKIGAALRDMKAEPSNRVSTHALAMELRKGVSDEKIVQAERELKLLARAGLKQYCEKLGNDFVWFMPASEPSDNGDDL